ncbi:hypothetical protein BC834DRAFT_897043 [Gloeopeniophorella convolvens]|nr:hypothetical protein BC834DRAFT_897043 [Gloeopeniophorella convolvens]
MMAGAGRRRSLRAPPPRARTRSFVWAAACSRLHGGRAVRVCDCLVVCQVGVRQGLAAACDQDGRRPAARAGRWSRSQCAARLSDRSDLQRAQIPRTCTHSVSLRRGVGASRRDVRCCAGKGGSVMVRGSGTWTVPGTVGSGWKGRRRVCIST